MLFAMQVANCCRNCLLLPILWLDPRGFDFTKSDFTVCYVHSYVVYRQCKKNNVLTAEVVQQCLIALELQQDTGERNVEHEENNSALVCSGVVKQLLSSSCFTLTFFPAAPFQAMLQDSQTRVYTVAKIYTSDIVHFSTVCLRNCLGLSHQLRRRFGLAIHGRQFLRLKSEV